ncbi:MAG: hypothetical protein Q9187_006510 [Circinaria calcarea]
MSLIGLAVLTAGLAYTVATYRSFSKNLAAARASNMRYVIVPIYFYSPVWLTTQNFLLPFLRRLPRKWTTPWLDVMPTEWTWEQQYAAYKNIGADTFIVVAPGGNMIWCADANAISQITTRRNDFPKPVDLYRALDIYGKNVVSTEGQVWRQHRKIASPPFTEKNNHMVWGESLHQAQAMFQSWTGPSGEEVRTLTKVAEDTMRLSLHIISRAGFGVRLLWPGVEDGPATEKETKRTSGSVGITSMKMGAGHTMTYTDALGTLLHNLLPVILMPRFLLKTLPFESTKLAYTSYTEWKMYMNELFEAKKTEAAAGEKQEGMDLMGALIQGAGYTAENMKAAPLLEKDQKPASQTLSDDEILGNAFVFIVAGHETSANIFHFSFILLAMHVSSQRQLQQDLKEIFQKMPRSEWDYERDLPKLFGGMAGAVMNEVLRLIPPAVNIPKSVTSSQPQSIILEGKKCLMPAGTMLNLSATAVHRNPKYWPTGPPSDPANTIYPTSNVDNDLEEFKPQRWFTSPSESKAKPRSNLDASSFQNGISETDEFNINHAPDTAPNLFRPHKGAYIPFSEGYRACIGRRFAQVEILAVLAATFTEYSVELAVDEWASDEEVEKMSSVERKAVWEKARAKARWLLRNAMGTRITIKLRNGFVPLRFVKKGRERFDFG